MTVSDTRTEATDKSGDPLVDLLTAAGHVLAEKRIVPDDIYQIRAMISQWIADAGINAVITTGGTGSPGVIEPRKRSRCCSTSRLTVSARFSAVPYEEINTSTIQSRAVAGVANATFIFCLPGSTGACRTCWGWQISHQLDYHTRPCNLVELMPRVPEQGQASGLSGRQAS